MTSTSITVVAVVSAIAAWLLLALVRWSGLAERIALDRPNARSLHKGVVPRGGGLAVIGITAIVGLVAPTSLPIVASMAGVR